MNIFKCLTQCKQRIEKINILKKEKQLIAINIIDNGKGLTEATTIKTHKSMSIEITKNRLKTIFNGKLKKARFKLETIKSEDKNKTIVSFYIPYNEDF